MANGFQTLGELLGGGVDTAGAYDEGRLHTAQTETALSKARNEQLKGMASEYEAKQRLALEDLAAQSGDPRLKLAATAAAAGYGNFDQTTQGAGNLQVQGFRDTVANPATPNSQRQFSLMAIEGKPQSPLVAIGQGGYTDITADAPTVMNTPLGDSMIDENVAAAALSRARAADPDLTTVSGAGGGPGGLRTPANMMPNPEFDPSLPPSDQNMPFLPIPGTGGYESGRENAFTTRVSTGAKNAIATLDRIVNMPASISTGFGQPTQGGVLDTAKGNLVNVMNGEQVAAYQVAMTGLDMNLAMLEGSGMMPTEATKAKYDALRFYATDTELTKLTKLVDYKQTIQSAIETKLEDPRVAPEKKSAFRVMLTKLNQIVPFEAQDVQALMQSRNPQTTIRDVVKRRQLTARPTSQAPAAPGATARPDLPLRDEQGWELMEDGDGNLAYVGPNGQIREVK